ncbi:MAG: hypothetical protein J5523_08425 [Muribaculaceae bacterium]|nr:hypothetical protein [Muribaculaceae bacterium]
MKKLMMMVALCGAVALAACNGGSGKGGNGRLPESNSGYTDEELENIMNQNSPLRQGVNYFHSKSMDYSVQYPVSFVDFKKDGDSGFSCHSKDGVASIKAWGEPCNMPLEDLFASRLAAYNEKGAEVDESELDDDDSFEIVGTLKDKQFYERTILNAGKSATFYYEFDTAERDDIDPEAIYSSLGFDLGETLAPGAPPVQAKPKKVDPNAVAQVAYVGKWHTFSTMTSDDFFKKYPEFKEVNSWEARTDGDEVYFVLAADENVKITVKNTDTGERLYNRDGRPLIVKCNKDGKPNVEITIISKNGKITRYVPQHDENDQLITTPGINDMTR